MPRRALVLLVLLLALIAAVFTATADWLTLGWLKTHRDDLIALCQRNMLATVLGYLLAFVAWAALCLPGVGLFALAGGMVFGAALGTVLATLAAVSGATLAFLAARYLLRHWAHLRFTRAFGAIDRGVASDGALYVFMLRLIVVVPFFVVNPVMGLTAMRLHTFVWASLLGMLANTFIWVNAGTMLMRINRIEDVLSAPVVLSLTLVGILPLVLKWLFLREK